jgi:hypothetical protein
MYFLQIFFHSKGNGKQPATIWDAALSRLSLNWCKGKSITSNPKRHKKISESLLDSELGVERKEKEKS